MCTYLSGRSVKITDLFIQQWMLNSQQSRINREKLTWPAFRDFFSEGGAQKLPQGFTVNIRKIRLCVYKPFPQIDMPNGMPASKLCEISSERAVTSSIYEQWASVWTTAVKHSMICNYVSFKISCWGVWLSWNFVRVTHFKSVSQISSQS